MTDYIVQAHDNHFHVIADGDTVLDDRPSNPWWFDDEVLADQVARLLNSGMSPYLVKDMDYRQIAAAAQHIH